MSVSSPYCTTKQVAPFARGNLKGQVDFSAGSIPTKETVSDGIALISGQIDMSFRSAGYKVPFVALSGETWPTDQTIFLQFLCAIGTSALVLGHAANPTPALGPGFFRGSGNVYQDLFWRELGSIWTPGRRPGEGTTSIRFRAQYYIGTPAEQIIASPKAPTSDFLENRHDPTASMDNRTAANAVVRMWRIIAGQDVNLNYLRGLFGISKGFAETELKWKVLAS